MAHPGTLATSKLEFIYVHVYDVLNETAFVNFFLNKFETVTLIITSIPILLFYIRQRSNQ